MRSIFYKKTCEEITSIKKKLVTFATVNYVTARILNNLRIKSTQSLSKINSYFDKLKRE